MAVRDGCGRVCRRALRKTNDFPNVQPNGLGRVLCRVGGKMHRQAVRVFVHANVVIEPTSRNILSRDSDNDSVLKSALILQLEDLM